MIDARFDEATLDTPMLTRKERAVVALVAEGLRNKEIAERLHKSDQTVKNQLYVIFQKLGARSRTHMVMIAVKNGLIGNPEP